jgi:hypothetical protein
MQTTLFLLAFAMAFPAGAAAARLLASPARQAPPQDGFDGRRER